MPDNAYQTYPLIFNSKGVVARPVDDTIGPGYFLNLSNAEELFENAMCSRLGSQIINRSGTTIEALPSTVYSLAKLSSLNGNSFRYAGSNGNLYRRVGTGQGPYTQIKSGMSGTPWISSIYNPAATSLPYIFIA